MEPHLLAIAALSEVASSSHHDKDRSGQSDAGASMRDKVIAHKAQEPSQQSQGTVTTPLAAEASQGSSSDAIQGLQSTSSDNSQTEGVFTPPNSDGFSSQSTNPEGQQSQFSQLSQLAAAAAANTPAARANLAIAPPSGTKRTADGQVKPTFTSPTSPHDSNIKGHSRNTSAVSAASTASSSIGQVNKALPNPEPVTDIDSSPRNFERVCHMQC